MACSTGSSCPHSADRLTGSQVIQQTRTGSVGNASSASTMAPTEGFLAVHLHWVTLFWSIQACNHLMFLPSLFTVLRVEWLLSKCCFAWLSSMTPTWSTVLHSCMFSSAKSLVLILKSPTHQVTLKNKTNLSEEKFSKKGWLLIRLL